MIYSSTIKPENKSQDDRAFGSKLKSANQTKQCIGLYSCENTQEHFIERNCFSN